MAVNDITKFVDGNGDEFNFRDPSKEAVANKVTSIRASSSATDTNYPSEKAVAKAVESASVEDKLYANQLWGGAFRTSLSPGDVHFFIQRNAFFGPIASAITVEYSTDGGLTWIDYNLTDSQKISLFSQFNTTQIYCGKNSHIQPGYTGSIVGPKDLTNEMVPDQRLRVTISCMKSSSAKWLYARLRRFGIYISTNSASASSIQGGKRHCVISLRTSNNVLAGVDTWEEIGDFNISEDAGWNSIPCANETAEGGRIFGSSSGQFMEIRFEFWSDGLSSSPNASQTGNLLVRNILAFSELIWTGDGINPNMTKYGMPCTVSSDGVANFNYGIKFTARKLKTKLDRTVDSTFDGSADQENIPVTGTLPVANGGTGKASVTANSYLKGNGTGALVERTYSEVRTDLGISDGANKVEASTTNGKIKIDGTDTTVYTHPTNGANTSKGDTTDQTPSFGQTFRALSATVDSQGHVTALAAHTVTIPNRCASGGNEGTDGLMSSADKDKVDALGTASTKDVPTSGNASDSQVVMGNDTRLSAVSGKVSKSGDTMTGKLTVNKSGTAIEVAHSTANANTEFRATRSDTGVSTWFGIGSGGTNHGLYSLPAETYQGGGWVVVTDENGFSSLTGKCEGFWGKNFGADATLRTQKRVKLGVSYQREDTYTRVYASAIIEARINANSVNGCAITMLLTISARGDSDCYFRLHVLSQTGWDVTKVCPVLLTQNVSQTATRVYLAFATNATSTSLKEMNYTDVRVLPINGAVRFDWDFAWDTNDYSSSTMTMHRPYVFPSSVVGTAVGDANTPVYVKNDGSFGTASDVVAVALKDSGRGDVAGTSGHIVKVGYDNSSVPATTPSGTSTYAAGSTVGTTRNLVTSYRYDGVAFYKDVDSSNVTVGNSIKWNGYSLVIGQAPTTPADNTLYIF